jgi:hypothetical protein
VAVYEGARPRTIAIPRRTRPVDAPVLPRRRMRGAVRARRRSNRLQLLLGGIVVAFMLAFFSLAQSVRVSATGYDINNLLADRQELLIRKQELQSDLNTSLRSARSRSTPASASSQSRSFSTAAERPHRRCSAEPTRGAASCSCW